MNVFKIAIISLLMVSAFPIHIDAQEARVTIDPTISHAIKGKLYLEREKYFNLSNGGKDFESKINNKTRSDYYYKDLGMSFGRDLGMVYAQNKWGNSLREDPARPGYADIDYLKSNLSPNNGSASTAFKNHFAPNLGVAMHDRNGMWPDWVEQYYDSRTDESHMMAKNPDAVAEMAFNILKHGYTDWTRPGTYEIMNEPHWAYYSNQDYADIHTKVNELVDADGLNVDVGGPCLSVGYFYKNNYNSLSSITGFIDNTSCDLDFYSFHVYDYLSWSSTKNDIVGRISTGLPIDGVIDAVNNYTSKKYNKEIQFVFSEHGGYISKDQETVLNTIADKYFPDGSGFDYEMKKRSVSNFNLVNSSIANTMAFMNHPHAVEKAVPFILLESFSWDPKYYSSLLVADNFTDKSNWIESSLINFYKFFAEVNGRRIESYCDDPDLQHHAYVDGNTMYLLFHNQSSVEHPLTLNMDYNNEIKRIRFRTVGRNEDFTPYYREEEISTLSGLSVKGRESVVLIIDFTSPVTEKKLVNETPIYANGYAKEFTGSSDFTIDVPTPDDVQYAVLRVSVGRPSVSNHDVSISLNGTALDVVNEDCADRLDNGNEYGSLKIVKIDTALLQESNTVKVSFSDGGSGGVGSVVLRAAYYSEDNVESMALDQDALSLYKGESKGIGVNVLPQTAGNKSVMWESLNESIASVDEDGLITGVTEGLVKIIATTEDGGFKDTCEVTVSELVLHSFANKSGWVAIAADSEGEVTPMPKQNAVDDDVDTYWHTEWKDGKDPLPHYIIVDMQEENSFTTFYYLPRQDQWGPNGAVGDFELYVSNDTSNWGNAVYTGSMNWPENPTEEDYKTLQTIELGSTATGRYFKFVGLTEHQNDPEVPYTAAAEFYISTKGNGISIPESIDIELGSKTTISAVIPPYNSPMDPELISWKSTNDAIATVLNGEITAKDTGSVEIICSSIGKVFSDTCMVKVMPIKATGIQVSKPMYTLYIDNYRSLTAVISPDNATEKGFTWHSDHPEVVSVEENGKITAMATGMANIIATTVDGAFTDTCKVEVVPVPVSSIVLSIHEITMNAGTSTYLGAAVLPRDADDKTFTWSSSNLGIATVDNGKVDALMKGTVNIIVTTNDGGFTDTCKITVIGGLSVSGTNNANLSVYPNPVIDGKLYVKGFKAERYYTIFGMSGKQISSGHIQQDQVDVSMLKDGFYFIRIGEEKCTFRFVVQ